MTDSNGKGPLYFVFLNENKKLIYAGTTDGINNDDLNLNIVTPDEGGEQNDRIDDVVNKIMNNDTMEKYFSKNNSSVGKGENDENDDDGYNLFNLIDSIVTNIEKFKPTLTSFRGDSDSINSLDKFNEINKKEKLLNKLDFDDIQTDNLKKHTVVNVGGDGNCFFYALFYSILAKCNNGKEANELIKEMFSIEINITDDHVIFAKNSNIMKSSDNLERNEKYKDTELFFATTFRNILITNEDYNENIKEMITRMKNEFMNLKKSNNQLAPDLKSIVDNFSFGTDHVGFLSEALANDNANINDVTEKYLQMFINETNTANQVNQDHLIALSMHNTEQIINPSYDSNPPTNSYTNLGMIEVNNIKKMINAKNYYVDFIFETKDVKYHYIYKNRLLLYNGGNHFQYIIPETPKPSSEKGGGKRKTQRKRPKSSHKNKSIKTK